MYVGLVERRMQHTCTDRSKNRVCLLFCVFLIKGLTVQLRFLRRHSSEIDCMQIVVKMVVVHKS